MVSHFFSTLGFINDLKTNKLSFLEPLMKYTNILNVIGYTCLTVSLISNNSCVEEKEEAYYKKIAIFVTGGLFSGLPMIENLPIVSKFSMLPTVIAKLISLAGIVHAFFVQWVLTPDVIKNVEIKTLGGDDSDDDIPPLVQQPSHASHASHASHGLSFSH